MDVNPTTQALTMSVCCVDKLVRRLHTHEFAVVHVCAFWPRVLTLGTLPLSFFLSFCSTLLLGVREVNVHGIQVLSVRSTISGDILLHIRVGAQIVDPACDWLPVTKLVS